MLLLKIKRIDEAINNPLPFYATEFSSGMDISSASREPIIISSLETKLIPTNLLFEIPLGYEGQIRPRSGLAIKHSIGILNSPGTIDSDYRGELKILLTNFGKTPYKVQFGDRIAQLVIVKTEKVEIIQVNDLSNTTRNQGGFGHTGIKHDK